MNKRFCLFFLLTIFLCSCKNITYKKSLHLLFPDKEDYKAAILLENNKLSYLEKFLDENNDMISRSYSSEHYYSILHEAVKLNNKEAVKLLLSKGFNPNILSPTCSPLKIACSVNTNLKTVEEYEDAAIVELLIDYGANPELGVITPMIYSDIETEFDQSEETPLMILSQFPNFIDVKKKIDVLIKKGHADLNYKIRTGFTAVTASLLDKDSIETAYYLICKLHADVNTEFYDNEYQLMNEPLKKRSPVQLLRQLLYPLDSEEYKLKQEIIEEFKNQGVDYYSEPVPQSVIDFAKQKYPDSWEDFLERY
ncbi:MAG: hypothetical protein K6E97_09760 [Treponema sp.]|nr:hypothetical protein [Treponema sp.]